MAWNLYGTFKERQHDANQFSLEDTVTYTFKIALVASGYTPSGDVHNHFDDITNEVTGTNYTAGGNATASPTVTLSSGTVTFDAADPATWSQSASGFSTARRAILYADSGTASTSPLIAYSDDFGADRGNVSGDFSIQLDASGIFTAT